MLQLLHSPFPFPSTRQQVPLLLDQSLDPRLDHLLYTLMHARLELFLLLVPCTAHRISPFPRRDLMRWTLQEQVYINLHPLHRLFYLLLLLWQCLYFLEQTRQSKFPLLERQQFLDCP